MLLPESPREFYDLLRRLTHEHDIKLYELAGAANMQPSALSRAMHRGIDPRLSTMNRLVTALTELIAVRRQAGS